MRPNWTASQRAAIESRGENLLLAAGAGSGKTAVLTERIARMAVEGIPLKNMLVVTFTKAAASEMRQRIQARLESIAREDPEAKRRDMARMQLGDFSQANISTLHAFCQNVLKRHFHEAGVDPGYRVGDEMECALLREDALAEVLEEACARDEEAGGESLADLTAALTDGRESIEELILRCYNMMMALPDPWDWLERSVAAYELDYEAFCDSEIWQAYRENCLRDLEESLAALLDIEEHTRNYEGYTPLYTQRLTDCIACLREGVSSLARGGESWPGIEKWPGLGSWKGEKRPPDLAALQDRAKAAYKRLPARLDSKAQWERANSAAPLLRTLAMLIRSFAEEYEARKQKKALVDFFDLEHKTLRALNSPGISAEYRQRFRAVFVDEYQDTNRVQEAIVTQVAAPGNLFTVGDIKQSIYRFRAADPLLFRSRAAAYERGEGGRRVDLKENFRSAPNILLAVNDVFERAMPLSGGEVEYGEKERLLPGRPDGGDPAPVSLELLVEGGQEEVGEEDKSEEEPGAVQKQAAYVARSIRSRMGGVIVENGVRRQLRYQDFAILLRTGKGAAEEVARALSREGIPAYTSLTGGYFAAVEVQVLINLLKLIDNRRQDVPLLSLMRAGLFGFVDDDLVRLRASQPREASLYDAFAAICQSAEEDGFSDRCRMLNSFLLEGKRRSRAMPLDGLIDWAAGESRYDLLTAALPGGKQRSANLRVLSSRARNYERHSAGGLHGFLQYMERLERAGMEMAEAVLDGEGADAVRVMTMHGSKGLEFPIVYLLNLKRQFNMLDTHKKLLLHRDLGMGASVLDRKVRLRGRTIQQSAIGARIAQETRGEELRMLYVAMTRAREELHMVALVKRDKKGGVSDKAWREPGKQNSLLDFLLYALLDSDQAAGFRNAVGLEAQSCDVLAGDWRIEAVEENTAKAEEEKEEREKVLRDWEEAALSAEPDRALAERYSWRYPAVAVAGKVTVSALASGRLHFDESPRFMEQRRMTAEDRGQALHSALEHLDWGGPLDRADIEAQLAEMETRELISPEQCAVIDPGILQRFASSSLGMRLREVEDLKRELPFTVLVDGKSLGMNQAEGESVVLQGVIDACFLQDGCWVLLDYKSDRVVDPSPNGLKAAGEKHREQVALYARALTILSGLPVSEAYIVLLSVGEAVPISLA